MHTPTVPGDLVWIRQRRWRVERVRRDRHVVRLDVANRDARLTFLAPFDRPGRQSIRAADARAAAAGAGAARASDRAVATALRDASPAPSMPPSTSCPISSNRRSRCWPARGACSSPTKSGWARRSRPASSIAELLRRDAVGPRPGRRAAALRDQWTAELQRALSHRAPRGRSRTHSTERRGHVLGGENPWRPSGRVGSPRSTS